MAHIVFLAGVILILYGAVLSCMSNLNLGNVLVVLVGIFLMLIGIFKEKIWKFTEKGIGKIIKILVIALIVAEVILVTFIGLYGFYDNISYNEDAVIVLGAGLKGDKVSIPLKLRLDKAIEYHEKNPKAVIVVSGGQGFQETVTEAYAMEKYLIENGVDKSKIIKEEESTSTKENLKYSKEILNSYFKKEYKIVVVTNNFHIFRSVKMAKNEGFENVTHLHAGLQWYNLMPCYLRESLAVLKMLILN